MLRTVLLTLAGLGIAGVVAYNVIDLPTTRGGTDPVDKAYSAKRVEIPEDAPAYASLSVNGQLTYDQLYGLHLKPAAQEKAFATIKQMLNANQDLSMAAFMALKEDFPTVNWEKRLSTKQQKVLTAYYYIAYVLEANGSDQFIRIDVDPIKPVIPGGCEGTIKLLKPGVWTQEQEVARPGSGDPNVTLREKYQIAVYNMQRYLGTASGKVKIPSDAPPADADIAGKEVSTPKGGMVMTHAEQVAAFDILFDGYLEAYQNDDIWTDPVTTAATALAPSCNWAQKTGYTPDMFAVWEDLNRLSELASHTAFHDPRVAVAGMQGA